MDHTYIILFSDFLSFTVCPFSDARSHPGSYLTFSHVSLSSSWLWQFVKLSWFLMTLRILRCTGHVFCIMFLNWIFSDVFPMISVMGFWKEDTDFHCIISNVRSIKVSDTVVVNIDHLDEVVCVKFLCSKIVVPPFPYYTLWKKLTMHSPHKEYGVMFYNLRAEYLHK